MENIKNAIKRNKTVVTTIALWLLVFLFFSITTANFLTANNVFNMLRQIAVLALISIGMMAVLVTGGIDLSVGNQMSLIGILLALMMSSFGIPMLPASILAILIGGLMGSINGAVITYTNINPMVATLAVSTILRGITYALTNAKSVYGLPEGFKRLGQGHIGPVPIPVVIAVIFLLLAAYVFKRTYIGRYFYAVGSNEEAARLSGLNVQKIRIISYGICGLLVGLGAVITTSRLNAGAPAAGQDMEMDVLTACVVGGVSLAGGTGSLLGVIFGVLLIGTLTNGMGVMGVGTYNQLIAKGLVLIIVIVIDGLRGILGKRRTVKSLAGKASESK